MNTYPISWPTYRIIRSSVLAALAVVPICSIASDAAIYEAAAAFSLINGNPNGVWTYGYRLSTPASALTVFPNTSVQSNGLSVWFDAAYNPLGTPSFAANLTTSPVYGAGMTWPPGRLSFHPSPIHDAVLRWTSPSRGEWDISALFIGMDGGTTNVSVIRGGEDVLFAATRSGTGANAGPFAAKVFLEVGETVEFVVNNAGSFYSDTTGLEVVISGGCPADFNEDGGIDGGDVETFFHAWEMGEYGADVNTDGGVDGADVGVFFAAWENGGC
ncbi:MAG: hypothetical protein JSR77_16460 [Planctomycetes bacterium]|nr:hypothetical protein [Planctomycetota bacterium]